MSAAEHDITIHARADYEMTLWLQDDNGDPLDDYSGYYAHMMIRRNYEGAVVKELDSNLVGGITIDGPNAKFTISIPFDETEVLRLRQGIYDLFIQDDEATPTVRPKLLYGVVTVVPAVTR